MRIRCLILSALLLFPLCASAVTHEGNGWRIQKRSVCTTAVCGGELWYEIEVTRTGPDAGIVDIVDGRDQDATTGYTFADPPPDFGGSGGDIIAIWVREMNQGDTFTARYGVQFASPLPIGQRVRNWVEASPTNLPHISVDYDIWVGAGNETARAHPCTGEAGEPINTATGEFFLPELVDLDLGGPLPLRFTRWYGSRLNDPGFDLAESALGVGWMHNYEVQAWKAIGSASWEWSMQVLTEGGKRVDFTQVYGGDGGWSLNLEQETVPYEFKYDGESFWFLDPARELLYRFDATAWSYAQEIVDRNGNSLLIQRRPDMLITNVTDGLGRSLDFQYTGGGNLSRVTDGTRTVGFAYDAQGTVIRVTNAMGHVVTYAYDPVHSHANLQGALMTGVQYPLGNIPYTQTYNADGRVIAQADAYGYTSTYTYVGGTTTITDPQGSFTHTHPNTRRATNLADQAGNAFQISYDTYRDLPTQVINRRGHAVQYQYELDSRRLTNVVHRDGGTTSYSYVWTEQTFTNREETARTVQFSFRDLRTITHPDGTTETFHRDARGNVTSYVDRAGAAWATTYNHRGQPLTVTRPGGGAQTFTYNADGTLASETDSDTGVTAYTYDALRRRVGATYPDGSTGAWVYNDLDRMIRITDGYGHHTDVIYDENNILVGFEDPLGCAIVEQTDLLDRMTNRYDSLGWLASRTYDNMGRVAAERDPAGTNTFAYDLRGWLTNRTRGARSHAWDYNEEGRVTRAVSPLGHVRSAGYDAMGRLASVTNPLGQATAFARDRVGQIVEMTDPMSARTHYAYDAEGRLIAVTNALGAGAYFEYDAEGGMVRHTSFSGRETSYGYTPMGRVTAITNALNEATRFTYDTWGRAIRMDHADGEHVAMTYDASDRMSSWTDESGQTWRYGYNALGDVTAITNPLGGVVTTLYNLDGTAQTRTDSDTGIHSNRFDAARRLVETVRPDGGVVSYEYNQHNELTAFTDARGGRTEYAYDADGQLITVTDPMGWPFVHAYDAAGRRTNTTDRAGGNSGTAYDATGRVIEQTDPTGVRTAYARDALGRATNITMGSTTWRMDYDADDVPTRIISPSGRETLLISDDLMRPVQSINALGHTHTTTYDTRDRVTSRTDPAGRVTEYEYDPRGLLAGITLPDSNRVAYTWDALGRLARVDDLSGATWTFSNSPMGRLQSVTDPLARATQYAYDISGRMSSITWPDHSTVDFTHDAEGLIERALYSTGLDLHFQRDALGRITNANGVALMRDPEGRITGSMYNGTVFGATYDAAGRLATATYDNNAWAVTYTYAVGPAGDGRLTRVSDDLAGTQVDFTYDADRRLQTIALPNGETIIYTWDDADRLTRIQSGNHVDIHLAHDLSGRITAVDLTAPLLPSGFIPQVADFTYDAASQISSAGYAYDALGRVTATPTHALTWDGASRLIGMDGVTLEYSGIGDVLARVDGADTNRFYHHHAFALVPIVAERDEATGAFQRYYVYTPAGRLLYMIDASDGNKVYFYHFDQNGNTLALTDTNAVVTDAWAYDPYGRILARTGANPQPFTFAGAWGVRQEGDSGTIYHMRARYYDAVSARFLSPEPIWPRLENPVALNPYQYAATDPIRYADPTGLQENHEPPHTIDRSEWMGQLYSAYEQGGVVGLALAMDKAGLWDEIHKAENPAQEFENLLGELHDIRRVLFRMSRIYKPAPPEPECHQEAKNTAPLYEVIGPSSPAPGPAPGQRSPHVVVVQGHEFLLEPTPLTDHELFSWELHVQQHLFESRRSLGPPQPPTNRRATLEEHRRAIEWDRTQYLKRELPPLQAKVDELKAREKELEYVLRSVTLFALDVDPSVLREAMAEHREIVKELQAAQKELDDLRAHGERHGVLVDLIQ